MLRRPGAVCVLAILIAAGCGQSPDQPAPDQAAPPATSPPAPPATSAAPAPPATPAQPAQPAPAQPAPPPAPQVVPVPVPVPYAVPGGGVQPMPEGYAPLGQVATIKEEANLRAQPNTTSTVLLELPAGTRVDVLCWVSGEPTYGNDTYGSMWLSLASGGYVHSYLATSVDVAPC